METTYQELRQQLGIHPTVISDINKQLRTRTDYNRKQKHGHSGGKAIFYTPIGKAKVTSYVEEVKKLHEGMQEALFHLGYQYNAKNSNSLNVLIGVGAYCYLKEQGYRLPTMAYILKRDRTTLYNTEKVMHSYKENPIANAVILETGRQLKKRLQWQDQ